MPRITWVRTAAVALALVGCGRLDFEAVPDAAGFPTGPFGMPQRVTELASGADDDDDATLTADTLEIYFASSRLTGTYGMADIFRSTRASAEDSWSSPIAVAELNTAANEENPGIAPDGLTMWFTRAGDIFVTTRAQRDSTWSEPARVAELSSSGDDLGVEPARSLLGMALYRESPRALYEARRPATDAVWAAPVPITELNSAVGDHLSGFFVTELELWFVSSRAGNHDLYRAVRPSIDEPFGVPVPIEGVNTPDREDDPWLSPDGRTLVFTSTRSGKERIYITQRVE